MLHILLHFVIPAVVARVFYTGFWRMALLYMLLSLLVDVDHLLADPIYDPERCSIGFHPLHSFWAIVVYLAVWLLTLFQLPAGSSAIGRYRLPVNLVVAGLLIHMLLDAMDCVV